MSQHVNERLLNDLLAGELSQEEERAVEEHLRTCIRCVRQLDDWRQVYPQVKRIIPTSPHATIPETRKIALPDSAGTGERARRWLVPVGALVVLAALAGGYVLQRSRSSLIVTPAADSEPGAIAPPAAATTTLTPAEAGQDSAAQPSAHPSEAVRLPPGNTISPASAVSKTTAPPASQDSLRRGEATRRLGGSIRLLDGQWPQQVLFIEGARIPGADASQPVVRLIYQSPAGRIIVDQQRRAGAEPRAAASGSTPEGVSVVQWVDGEGFWITLAAQIPERDLLAIKDRVR